MFKKMIAVLSLFFSTTALAEFSCEVEVNYVLVCINDGDYVPVYRIN